MLWVSFELQQWGIKAIQTSTHNIFYYKDVDNITGLQSQAYKIAWRCAYRGMCGN